MPYGGPPLSEDQIGAIGRWIDAGAAGPDATTPIASSPPPSIGPTSNRCRPIPQVKNVAWCRNPIDNFILAKLEKEGLKPSPSR